MTTIGKPQAKLGGDALVRAIRERPNDAPLPTEYLLEDAADELERLIAAIRTILRMEEGDGAVVAVFFEETDLREHVPGIDKWLKP